MCLEKLDTKNKIKWSRKATYYKLVEELPTKSKKARLFTSFFVRNNYLWENIPKKYPIWRFRERIKDTHIAYIQPYREDCLCCDEKYKTGFHIFKTVSGIRQFQQQNGWRDPMIYKILEVKIANVCAKGWQDGEEVLVCRTMKLIREYRG